MNEESLKRLLTEVQQGRIDLDQAIGQLKTLPFEDLGFARVDHHRELRKGYPETIFAQGKTPDQVKAITEKLLAKNSNILITRAEQSVYDACYELDNRSVYHDRARVITIQQKETIKTESKILIMSAGTSDIPVCEEAAITAEMMGNTVERLFDVGVAGIHRLLSSKAKMDEASVLVVVAGMDGVLPSVVAGLIDKPIIAVPTSVGYGAHFNGLSALLTMLNSCASGVTVVNIDNGYGAGYSASVINQIANKAI